MRVSLTGFVFAAFFGLVSSGLAATMSGTISDSMCGSSHANMMSAHKDLKTDSDCTLACVRAGGKYVFVSNGKIYQIANQDQADLRKDAGEPVRLNGNLNGDTITVSKISMRKKK